ERVVLLPQGDFAAFLRSSAEDRRKVLDRLFDVSTYGGVEAWLADRRREGAAGLADRRAHIGRLTASLTEVVAAVPASPSPASSPSDLPGRLSTLAGSALDPAALTEHLPVVEERLDSAVIAALAEHDAADGLATVAAQTLEAARLLAATRAKGQRARVERAALADAESRLAPVRLVVTDAERAAPLRGHLETAARAAADQRRAATAADLLLGELGRVGLAPARPGSALARSVADVAPADDRHPGAADLRLLHARLAAQDSHVAAVDRARDDLLRLERRRTAQRELGEAAGSQLAPLAVGADEADAALTTLAERRQAALALGSGLTAEVAAQAELTRLHALRVAIRKGAHAISAAGDALRTAVDADQSAKDAVITLRTARLDGMAAELAGQLSDGQPCAVCGSPEHPRPATGRHTVTADDVTEAERVSQDLLVVRSSRAAALATLEGAQAERLAALGDDARDLTVLTSAMAQATERVAIATRADRDAEALESEIVTTRTALAAARTAHDEMAARVTSAGAALAELGQQVSDAIDVLLASARAHTGGCPCAADARDDVSPRAWTAVPASSEPGSPAAGFSPELDSLTAGLVTRHRSVAHLLGRAVDALEALEQRSADRATVEKSLARELAAAGFADSATGAAALVDRVRLGALVDEIRQHDDAVVRVEAILADVDIVAALAAPAPDVAAAQAGAGESREAARQALRRHTETRTALDTGRRLIADLTVAVAEFAPAAARQHLLAEVADATAGNGSNTRRMPLSSYVLAARLERVVELANERLVVMGEGRFELRHTDDRSGNAKSGLGLEVIDLWTGMPRATSTLSGGESFMASLALALGLADAVREEAGGVDLQTLFVDEGFGTLDDESLEQVMAVLDTLRDGGRAVGVVSHVADLRTRIPRQVKVTKTPHGSSVTLIGTEGSDVA
ncbi:MAG: SbcC/MukB-like Walker B domain-containing protein, partial [Nostocoides sp.]